MSASAQPISADLFATHPLTRELPADLRGELLALAHERSAELGEFLVRAGEPNETLFFIVEGEVEVLSGGGGAAVVLARLGPGQVAGELSAFTGEPAIASVRVASARAALRWVCVEEIEHHPHAHVMHQHLLRGLLRIKQERLARTNESYAAQLRATQALLAERRMAARFLLLVLGLSSVSTLIGHWLQENRGVVDIYAPAFAWVYLVVLGLPTALLCWRERLPPAFYGLTTRNLGRDLAWSAGIVAVAAALLLAGLAAAGYPLAERFRPDYLLRYGPLYLTHSAVQEFIGRGVLLGLMLRLFGGETLRGRLIGNAAISFLFGMTHLHFGLGAVALTAGFSFALGAYYLVHRNLAGPIVIHGALGILAFMLGLI